LRFVLLVVVLSVPFWLAGAAFEPGLPLPFKLPVGALMFVCPLIAALFLVYREEGTRGVRRLLQRVFDYRRIRPRIWLLPIFLLLPVIYLLSYWAMRLMGRQLPEPEISILSALVLFALFFVTGACEETGWSGYATDPLQERLGALGTALILGAVWALWHVVPNVQAGRDWEWIAGQVFYTVALRVLIVWVYNNTAGAVLAAAMMHAMDNVSAFSFPNNGSHYDPIVVGAITTLVAMSVVYLWGPKTLARFRFARRQALVST
jgi:membrane protease YdiL (CAAX protease family)